MPREVTIYGAGMSGLVCGINLARQGYAVVIHEREKSFGGDSLYNPSTHTTPIDIGKTSAYIGIDIAPAFHPLLACPIYFHDTCLMAPVSGVSTVERGDRSTSLDSLLYAEALAAGVEFAFGSKLKRSELAKLAPDTVIACGLTAGVYDMLGIPYRKWYGYISRGEIGFSNYSWIWRDEGITEYGYLSSANNYYFNLLFSIHPVSQATLSKYCDFMRRTQGVEHDRWLAVQGAYPVARPDNPRLFHEGFILCGTMTGAVDPMGWFGILGALVTGKVAALAIEDRVAALKEFQRFTRLYRRFFFIKKRLGYPLGRYVTATEKALKMIGPHRLERFGQNMVREDTHLAFSIPGFANLGCY